MRGINRSRSLGSYINAYDDNKSKTIITASLSFLVLTLLLFFPIISFKEVNINASIPFSGKLLISMLINQNFDIEAIVMEIYTILLHVPKLVPGFITAYLTGGFIVTAVNIFTGFIRKKSNKFIGLAYIFLGISGFMFYLYCIISENFTTINRMGTESAFYKLYEMGPIFLVSTLLFVFIGSIQYFLGLEKIRLVKRFWFIYMLLIIPTILMFIFNYYPIFLQTIMSFKEYRFSEGIWGSQWVGLEHIKKIFTDQEIFRVATISVKLSFYRLFVSILPPLVLSILLFDLPSIRLRKVVQTIIYIPHFFSWVVIYAIFYAFMSNTGAFNQIIKMITGDYNFYIDFLTNPKTIIPSILISQVWKEIGWGTILYLAALSNIDPALYEVASIDGAGPLRKIWNITLPNLMPLIIFLALLQIGAILANGLEQILLFANLAVRERVYTIELWVYRNGIGQFNYGLASAVGFIQSVIGLVMVLLCNKLSIKTVGRGLW